MVQEKDTDSVHLLRRCLKERLQRDYSTLLGYERERSNIAQLLQRTVETGESNSLLLIGPRGVGKTTVRTSKSSASSHLGDGFWGRRFRWRQFLSGQKLPTCLGDILTVRREATCPKDLNVQECYASEPTGVCSRTSN